MNKPENVDIILKGVRLSFPALFKARSGMKNDSGSEVLKFSASFILDKKADAAQIEVLQAGIKKAWLATFGPNAGKVRKHPLRDGEEYEGKDGYGAHVNFIGAKNNKAPVVIDGKKNPLTEKDGKPYAGCYVNAKIRLYGFTHTTGGKQVCASLEVVQFVKDGAAFGAGSASLDDMPTEAGSDSDIGLDDL